MQPKVNIYRSLEKQAGEKFQDHIEQILVAAGFDSKTAIKTFSNGETFVKIEAFVNENRGSFEIILKGTKYENLVPFKFLPGHIALLSGLPGYLVELNNKKQNRRADKKQVNTIRASGVNQPSQQSNESAIQSDEENSIDLAEIRRNLIRKITKFASNKKIVVSISEDNILDFRSENNSIKCYVECPFCIKKVPCNYVKNWSCGNFTAHLKTHANSTHEIVELNLNDLVPKVIDKNATIIRLANGNGNDLSNILKNSA